MKIVRAIYHKFVQQKMPDRAAEYYEKLINGVSEFYLKPFCEKILIKYPGPIRILDIGTGTGQLPIMLAQNNKNYQITAIDLSEKCIKIARAKAASAKVSQQITFICGDFLRVGWNTESFDLIVSTCSMHHWRQPAKILRKTRQLIVENGEVWILDDLAGVSFAARRKWINKVELACKPGWLFKTVFSLESIFLAYSHLEIEKICRKVGLSIIAFSNEGVFFIAQMTTEH